ncbi:hypothetical protein HYC85_015215 [Camellia sinensis]|uniref:Uncharacterized protein n=1 Tax=Camellia sinensis TaxID=4442 RepID=A0A7J7GX12_CAMSI|nr:hypothetical protein HYC85_015215 [Camellia sinensis]
MSLLCKSVWHVWHKTEQKISWWGCEREVAEAANGVSDELKSERIMRFSWALVHSKQPEDVQRGIAMLEGPCQKLNNSSLADSLANSGSPLQESGEYRRSRQLAEQCLEIAPDWMQALTLKKTVDDQITKGCFGNSLLLVRFLQKIKHNPQGIKCCCGSGTIHGCEREVAEAANGVSDELKSERIMRLSWALVHSKQPEDMQRGIAMLEASLANSGSPLQKREKLYLLEYRRSRQLAEQCLEIAPDWMQALTLKKTVNDQITKGCFGNSCCRFEARFLQKIKCESNIDTICSTYSGADDEDGFVGCWPCWVSGSRSTASGHQQSSAWMVPKSPLN